MKNVALEGQDATAERHSQGIHSAAVNAGAGFRDWIREARPIENESPTARSGNSNRAVKLEIIVYAAPVRITLNDDNCPFCPCG